MYKKREIFDSIDSTNDYLEKFVYDNENIEDRLVIAFSQTKGKGKDLRYFHSPKGLGIYFSLLHVYKNVLEFEDLTLKVGFIISKVLEKEYNIKNRVKLINDIYVNDRKVVGILCKHIMIKKALIIGVGIDLYKNDNLPNDIKEKAGYIFDKKIDEIDFVENIVKNIYNLWK